MTSLNLKCSKLLNFVHIVKMHKWAFCTFSLRQITKWPQPTKECPRSSYCLVHYKMDWANRNYQKFNITNKEKRLTPHWILTTISGGGGAATPGCIGRIISNGGGRGGVARLMTCWGRVFAGDWRLRRTGRELGLLWRFGIGSGLFWFSTSLK